MTVPQLLRASAAPLAALALAVLVLPPAAADVNRIVLRVNDEIATLYEFEQRRSSRIQEIQSADLPPETRQRLLAEVGAQTMREMYEELLVLSRADQLSITVTEREVQEAMEQTRERFGITSEERFRAALESSGMTLDDLADQMRRNLLIRAVMGREVQQKIELEEEDLRRYYRDHPDEFSRPRRLQVREVVVAEDAADSAEAREALADDVRQALLAGEDGAETLAELSRSDGVTGVLELGWVERGDLEAALEKGIWDLGPGAVSQPIPARGGLHLVEVVAEEEARLEPFADVQERIRNKLRAERYNEEMADFLAELEESSYVVQNPPPEAAGFRIGEHQRRDEMSAFGLVEEDLAGTAPTRAQDEESGPESEGSEPPE